MKKIITLGLIFLLLLAFNVAGAKKNAAGAQKHEYVPNEIIVKLKDNENIITGSAVAKTGVTAIDSLKSKHKVTSIETVLDESADKNKMARNSFKKHGIDGMYLLKTGRNADIEDAVRELNSDPNVEYAQPNYVYHIYAIPNDSRFSNLYGLHNTGQTGGTADADIDAPEAWDLQTGSNSVVIAVIDTGVDYNHADLSPNIWANAGEVPSNGLDDDGNGFIDDTRGWDFANNDNDPFDDQGHGTHVAGTIGAVGNDNTGVAGVNWNVKIMPLKFLNSAGSGSTVNAISAVQYATLMGADIMSNSWGGTVFDQALKDAIQAASDAGILFVAAAGNAGTNNDAVSTYPANYDVPNVISVAATDHNDQKAGFSNFGAATVDLGAPGVSILSTVPTGSCSLCNLTGYRHLSGTSMATPHVSGVAGLIKAQFPALTSNGIKARLLSGVDQIPSLNGITVTGGRLNALNALETDTTPPSAITDLAAINSTASSVMLTWTAAGDDGNAGTAKSYDIRYSTSPITELNWDGAAQAANEPLPQSSGSSESFTVTGLADSTTYHFAMKAIDNVGNPSDLSNGASGTTATISQVFQDDMENGANGWASNGLWHQETKRAYSPVTSWAYNTGSPNFNYDIGPNSGSLTSPVIDLSSSNTVILKFKYLYSTESDINFDKKIVQIGVNGVFSNVAQITGTPMLTWINFSLDISQFAAQNSNVQVRFLFDTVDTLYNNFEGWYIDNVEVLSDSGPTNNAPVANAGPDKTVFDLNGDGAEQVAFNGSDSFDPDGSIAAYEWKEGVTVLSNLASFIHNFNVGTHNIILTVTDNGGLSDSDDVVVTVTSNAPPVADDNGPYNGFVGVPVTFNGAGSFDPEGNSITYSWDFGDGSTGTGINPAHVYSSAGVFPVTLIVNDGSLDSSPSATTASITEQPQTNRALLLYGEEKNSPSYRIMEEGGNLGIESAALSIGGQPDWIEAASSPKSKEIVMVTLDELNHINSQVWNGNSWGNLISQTTASSVSYKSIDVEYESQSGDAMVVYADLSGTSTQDQIPRYNIWNGNSWSSQGQARSVGAIPRAVELASNPTKDEIILVTNDASADINAQVWNGNSWGSAVELTANSYSSGQPFDVAYESLSGDGLIVYTRTTNSDRRVRYRVVSNGVIGAQQFGPVLGNFGRMYNLISDPNSDEIILMVIDNDRDTRILVWNGNSWSDKGEVSINAQSSVYMSIAGAYESQSGDAILVYSDNTAMPKYRVWDGASLSAQQNAVTGQNVPRWMSIVSNPNSDEIVMITNTNLNNIDMQHWNGLAWDNMLPLSTADTTATRGGVAVVYE